MQTKKRKMKAGEALVGMKRSGSQLRHCVSETTREKISQGDQSSAYLLRQNIVIASDKKSSRQRSFLVGPTAETMGLFVEVQ